MSARFMPGVLGVDWNIFDHLTATAAALAVVLIKQLICVYVDPADYLTEWAPRDQRMALSLDPISNEEAEYPAGAIREKLERDLIRPGLKWSFRVLNGDIRKASSGRLARRLPHMTRGATCMTASRSSFRGTGPLSGSTRILPIKPRSRICSIPCPSRPCSHVWSVPGATASGATDPS